MFEKPLFDPITKPKINIFLLEMDFFYFLIGNNNARCIAVVPRGLYECMAFTKVLVIIMS